MKKKLISEMSNEELLLQAKIQANWILSQIENNGKIDTFASDNITRIGRELFSRERR